MIRELAKPVAVGVAIAAAFFAGISVERSGNNPVPAAVPVVGDKPKWGVVTQDGHAACDLYKRYPSGSAFKKDEGCPVAVGKGFRSGFHTIRDGWTVKDNVVTLVVVNGNPGSIGGFHNTFHLNRYDGGLVEILWCKTEPFRAGEAKAISCGPLDATAKPEPFDNVWIS